MYYRSKSGQEEASNGDSALVLEPVLDRAAYRVVTVKFVLSASNVSDSERDSMQQGLS